MRPRSAPKFISPSEASNIRAMATAKPARPLWIFSRNGKRSISTIPASCRKRRLMITEFLKPAPPDYKWPLCPEADRFVEESVDAFLSRHEFARRLSERMKTETSTLFSVWVDHLILPSRNVSADDLKR